MPTVPLSVQAQLDAITLRLNALDGIGLNPKVSSQVASLRALISGLKKTLGNVNLGYQTEIGKVGADLLALKITVSGLLNIPPAP